MELPHVFRCLSDADIKDTYVARLCRDTRHMIDQYLRVRYWFLHFRVGMLHTALWGPCPEEGATIAIEDPSTNILAWRGPEDLKITLFCDRPGWTHAAKKGRHLVISVGSIGKKANLTRIFKLDDIRETKLDVQDIIQRVPHPSGLAYYVSEHGTFDCGSRLPTIRGSVGVDNWRLIKEYAGEEWCGDPECKKDYDRAYNIFTRRCLHTAGYHRTGTGSGLIRFSAPPLALFIIDDRRLLFVADGSFHIHNVLSIKADQDTTDDNTSRYHYRRCGMDLIRFDNYAGTVALDTLVERGGVFSWKGFRVLLDGPTRFQTALTFYH
jgi:hypothetical protein